MKTLYEDLLTEKDLSPELREILTKAMVIKSNNVLEYLKSQPDQRYQDVLDDYPTIAPPNEFTWVEYTLLYDLGVDVGYLVVRQNIEDFRSKLPAKYQFTNAKWGIAIYYFYRDRLKKVSEEHKQLFETIKTDHIIPLIDGEGSAKMYSLLNSDGTIVLQEGKPVLFSTYSKAWEELIVEDKRDIQEVSASDFEYLSVALFTFSLMHCKNVIVEEEGLLRGEKKKRNRHNKPRIRYHVLKIKPMVQHRGTGEFTGGTTPSMHIRRGHFKTFTDEAPLFGKWKGLYWWESAVISRKSKTVVLKDYDVFPPAANYSEPLTDTNTQENSV